MDKSKVEKFIEEIIEIYKKYNLSIAHEDTQGGFIIEDFCEYNCKWLKGAGKWYKE